MEDKIDYSFGEDLVKLLVKHLKIDTKQFKIQYARITDDMEEPIEISIKGMLLHK